MEHPFDSIALVIIDGIGCGESADCAKVNPEDLGANSLVNASHVSPVDAPNIQSIGLENVPGLVEMRSKHMTRWSHIRGAFGAMEPTFAGKGSPEGHQALMGWEIKDPYLLFDKTPFPDDLIADTEAEIAGIVGRPVKAIRYPGTDNVSGTVFIEHSGHVQLESKDILRPLIYASSDSVLQIALHQEIVRQNIIKRIGQAIREEVCNKKNRRIGRVIMRPFVGVPGNFERVFKDRLDFGMDPDGPTLIDHLSESGIPVYGIGKAADMLNYKGFPEGSIEKGKDDFERIEILKTWMQHTPHPHPPPSGEVAPQGQFIFANLNATDELFGHRRQPREYITHINAIDRTIGGIQREMNERSLIIITSDHGNDPTHSTHTNHTRERVPLLCYHPRMNGPIPLGIRKTYADIAATIAENYRLNGVSGTSFLFAVS